MNSSRSAILDEGDAESVATRKQKIKVGVFLVACIALASLGVMLVGGMLEEKGENYWIEFNESVLGLYEGGIVEYLGVTVGKVTSIYVTDANRALTQIVIDPNKVRLREGVEARLVLYSFATGTMAISLSGGDPHAPQIKPGSRIPSKTSMIGALSTRSESIIEDLASISQSISTGLAGIQEGDLTAIVDKVNRLLDKGEEIVDDGADFIDMAKDTLTDLRGDMKRLMEDFSEVTQDIRRLGANLDERVMAVRARVEVIEMERLQTQVSQVLDNFASVSAKLEETLAHYQDVSTHVLDEVDNVEYTLRAAVEEIGRTLASVRVLADQLKEDPSSLVRGKGIRKEPR